MDYTLISADDHLDLQYLPSDLWTARLPQMGHLAPEVRRQLTRDNAAALYGL